MKPEDKAVVQQALEALEALNDENSYWWQEVCESVLISLDTSRDALRQLLEQPEPVQEHEHALEQALTRLQKRYAELEAKVAAQPTPVQDEDLYDLAVKADNEGQP